MPELATDFVTPYVGIRPYSFTETDIFAGRDADIVRVAGLVANRARWRLILLHGQTGCGKSSFLKAGFIPEVTSSSLETAVFDRTGDGSYSLFITSSSDPMTRLAEAAVDLARQHVPADILPKWLSPFGMGNNLEIATSELARSATGLAQWFEALAPMLRQPLLLVVDQAEELFTLRVDDEADRIRTLYFDFLAEYCGKSSWIQILISMRTEFYGRFDHELRLRLGDAMRVAPYYLQPFSKLALESVVTAPLERLFRTETGIEYMLRFEDDLPQRIADAVAKRFPGPGALTCLQIVCVQLHELALAGSPFIDSHGGSNEVVITNEMFNRLGVIEDAIEDVVDRAVGDFCDAERLSFFESNRAWKKCKLALGELVTHQSGGAPTTKFIVRERFIQILFEQPIEKIPVMQRKLLSSMLWFFPKRYQRLGSLLMDSHRERQTLERLVEYLLLPNVRVLRETTVVKHGHTTPTCYLGLGHDVLAVGLAEAASREALLDKHRAEKKGRLKWKMIAIPVTCGAIAALVAAFTEFLGKDYIFIFMMGTLVGMYGLIGMEFVEAKRRNSENEQLKILKNYFSLHSPPVVDNMRRKFFFKGELSYFDFAFVQIPSIGLLFRELTANARREAEAAGRTMFPGGPRF